MKLAGAALARAVSQPDRAVRFYLFYGPDEAGSRVQADRLLGALGAEKFAVPPASVKADPAILADEAGAMALFGGPRAIWVEPAGDEIAEGVAGLLEAPGVESVVIAIGGALRKTSALVKLAEGHNAAAAAISYVPEGRDAVRIVTDAARREGLRVDQDVADRLATDCAGNQAVIAQELVKYALFLGATPESPQPLSHDVLDTLGAESAESNFGRIADLALSGEGVELFAEIERAALSPNEAIPVVRALQRRLLQIAPMRARVERGENVVAVMTSLGKVLFWKDKSLVGRLLRSWNAGRIAELLERSAAVEKGVLFSDQPPLAALGEELATIARVAARRR